MPEYDLPCRACGTRGLDYRCSSTRQERWEGKMVVTWEIGEYVCPGCGATERHSRVSEIKEEEHESEKSD